jgi:hypothetical protein
MPITWLFIEPESCGIIKPPNVVSISYGQDEYTATVPYATRQCREYGKLGMMGTTIIYSSGDNGVAGNSGICLNATGKCCHGCAFEISQFDITLCRSTRPRWYQIQPFIPSNMSFRYCCWGNADQSRINGVRTRERLRASHFQRWWL